MVQQTDPQTAHNPAPTTLDRPFPLSGPLAREHVGAVDVTLCGLSRRELEPGGESGVLETSRGRELRWPRGPSAAGHSQRMSGSPVLRTHRERNSAVPEASLQGTATGQRLGCGLWGPIISEAGGAMPDYGLWTP